MNNTIGIMRMAAKIYARIYRVDESLLPEIIDVAMFAYENIYVRRGSAVRIATLYTLARRHGVDIAKLMPRYARKRAHFSLLLARMLAARRKKDRQQYDDIDKFLHSYAYAIFLAAFQLHATDSALMRPHHFSGILHSTYMARA